MTAASKTERQLIDSIRKAKTGHDEPAEPNAATTPDSAAADAEQSAAKPARKTVGAASARRSAKRPSKAADAASAFSVGRRVWPD